MPRVKKAEPRDRGTIEPRGENKWLIRFYLGRDDAGKRKYSSKVIPGTYKQAQQALTKALGTVDEGVFVAPTKLSVCEYLTGYRLLSDLTAAFTTKGHAAFKGWLGGRRVALGPKTFRSYCDRIRLDVLPSLGHVRLGALTRSHIQALVTTLSVERGHARATIRQSVVVLGAALEQAVEDGLLAKNATRKVALPKRTLTTAKALTPEQITTFLSVSSGSPRYALWVVLLTTSLRPQEALALTWDDLTTTTLTDDTGKAAAVDVLSVTKALVEVRPGVYAVDVLKTTASKRTVTLPAGTVAVLKAHRQRQAAEILKAGAAYTRHNLIFAGRTGETLDLSAVRRRWKADVKAAGVPEVRLYDARHSAQTALVASGMNPKAVAARGGHSVEILMSTYAHVLDAQGIQAANLMDRMVPAAVARG